MVGPFEPVLRPNQLIHILFFMALSRAKPIATTFNPPYALCVQPLSSCRANTLPQAESLHMGHIN